MLPEILRFKKLDVNTEGEMSLSLSAYNFFYLKQISHFSWFP